MTQKRKSVSEWQKSAFEEVCAQRDAAESLAAINEGRVAVAYLKGRNEGLEEAADYAEMCEQDTSLGMLAVHLRALKTPL